MWRTGTHDMAEAGGGGSHLRIEMLAEHAAEIAIGAKERPTDADDVNDTDLDLHPELLSMSSASNSNTSSSSSDIIEIDICAVDADAKNKCGDQKSSIRSSGSLDLDELDVL